MEKVNVLVVEDDISTQRLYKKVFPDNLYDCAFAADGETALNKYKENSPDLIVLDIMLPILPGFLVLHKIRKDYNDANTKIIISTALSSQSDILACTKLGIQGYIVKPFRFKDVRKRIMDLMGLEDSIENEASPSITNGINNGSNNGSKQKQTGEIKKVVAEFISGEIAEKEAVKKIIEGSKAQKLDLPSMPNIIFRIQEAMNGEDSSVKNLADILSSDPALSVKIISLSNSSFYRGVKDSHTMEEAVMRIGMTESKELAIVLANRGMYSLKDNRFKTDVEKLFNHSVAVGVAARIIAGHLNRDNLDFIFSLGILHDIGKLVLLRIFTEIFRKDVGIDLISFRKLIQKLHNTAGHYYFQSLGLQSEFTQIALLHDTQDQSFDPTDLSLPIIVTANLLSRKLGYGAELLGAETEIFSTKAAKHLKLEENITATIAKGIEEYFSLLQQTT